MSSVPQHPLSLFSTQNTRNLRQQSCLVWSLTDVELVSRVWSAHLWKTPTILSKLIPFIVYGLDNEAQSWADCVDILAHDLLHDSSLACIVQASFWSISIVLYLGIRENDVFLTASVF